MHFLCINAQCHSFIQTLKMYIILFEFLLTAKTKYVGKETFLQIFIKSWGQIIPFVYFPFQTTSFL